MPNPIYTILTDILSVKQSLLYTHRIHNISDCCQKHFLTLINFTIQRILIHIIMTCFWFWVENMINKYLCLIFYFFIFFFSGDFIPDYVLCFFFWWGIVFCIFEKISVSLQLTKYKIHYLYKIIKKIIYSSKLKNQFNNLNKKFTKKCI